MAQKEVPLLSASKGRSVPAGAEAGFAANCLNGRLTAWEPEENRVEPFAGRAAYKYNKLSNIG